MTMFASKPTRLLLALVLIAGAAAAFWQARGRLQINTDITAALPGADPVVASARRILTHHPALENAFLDLSLDDPAVDREALLQAADLTSGLLERTGLVRVVKGDDLVEALPLLFKTILDNLPVLFGLEELNRRVEPLLSQQRIKTRLENEYRKLFDLSQVGQAEALAKDPLGLREIALERMSALQPGSQVTIHRGRIMTGDGRRLLLVVEPLVSSRETDFAVRLTEAIEEAAAQVRKIQTQAGVAIKLTYAGAFRAALDNERTIRRDTARAMILVTVGEILLILLCFRRPWLGFLALAPAVTGSMLATFVYARLKDSIFALSLGFGGALISITLDHGLAYVCLLDRPYETRGWRVSAEVWAVASFTIYTTLAALLSLTIIGIPLFQEVGLFAALGVALAAVMVHIIFPLVFPRLSGARRTPVLPLEKFMNRLSQAAGPKTLAAAGLVFLVMLLFARPVFQADFQAMNTITPDTAAAEQTIGRHWGNITGRTYILIQGRTSQELWSRADALGRFLTEEIASGTLAPPLPAFTLAPGPETRQSNLKAWRQFWTPERRRLVLSTLDESGTGLGFSPGAFAQFYDTLDTPKNSTLILPETVNQAFGVFPDKENNGYVLVTPVNTGRAYQAEAFFKSAVQPGFHVFDPNFFSRHLAENLSSSFQRLLLILGGCSLLLMLIRFADDWRLLLTAQAPLIFALAATLGTMNLLGLPLTIPSLMLAPIVIGMGVDYGLYLVCSRQRLGSSANPSAEAVPVAVALAGLSTLVGMGSLALSDHAVLQAAGLSTFLGIAYSMIGAFALTPPLLNYIFAPPRRQVPPVDLVTGSAAHRKLVLRPYRHLAPYPRFFARFKMLLDPMFHRLADFVRPGDTIIDIGCGFGVPAAWLLAVHPDLTFYALEPSRRRAEVAAVVLGRRGRVTVGRAPDLPPDAIRADAALLLDVAHYLSDEELSRLLVKLREVLKPSGRLVLRVTVPGGRRQRWQRWLEAIKARVKGIRVFFRDQSALVERLNQAGFQVDLVEPTAEGREETWFIGSIRN
ncbi:MAG: methyltransferase [Thermodesulfobacteriota bacterium]